MSETWRCRHCGELIGVYEPLVKLIDGRAHETSRAREPQLAVQDECYHRACYARLDSGRLLAGEQTAPSRRRFRSFPGHE